MSLKCKSDTSSESNSIQGAWETTSERGDFTDRFVCAFKEIADSSYVGVWASYNAKTNQCYYRKKMADVIKKDSELRFKIEPNEKEYFKVKLDEKSNKLILFRNSNNNSERINLAFTRLASILESENIFLNAPVNGYPYVYQRPESIDNSWKTSSLTQVGLDSSRILSGIDRIINLDYGDINSLLIIKNSKLVIEEYFNGFSREQLQFIASNTKSIISLLIGLLSDQGKIKSLEESMFSFFPEYSALYTINKNKIKLKHILTMTEGLDYKDNQDPLIDMSETPVRSALERPMTGEVGKEFSYDDWNTNILGGIIHNKTGIMPDKYCEKMLFKKLGIDKYEWEKYPNGFPRCHTSIKLKPRDMAKIGYLILNQGSWNGEQLISKKWITESTKPHVIVDKKAELSYGYQWWYAIRTIEGQQLKIIFGNGYGSQFIFIIPSLDLIVVTTGNNFNNNLHWSVAGLLEEYILPSAL